MKKSTRAILAFINDYREILERLKVLKDENTKYNKMYETIREMETSDINTQISENILTAIANNNEYIDRYEIDIALMIDAIDTYYDIADDYRLMAKCDIDSCFRTWINNATSDLENGYSPEYFNNEVNKATTWRDKCLTELNANDTNEGAYAYLINHGAIDIF